MNRFRSLWLHNHLFSTLADDFHHALQHVVQNKLERENLMQAKIIRDCLKFKLQCLDMSPNFKTEQLTTSVSLDCKPSIAPPFDMQFGEVFRLGVQRLPLDFR